MPKQAASLPSWAILLRFAQRSDISFDDFFTTREPLHIDKYGIAHIDVKGAGTVAVDVLETDRGPVVGPAFEGDFGALSMSATWLDPGNAGALFDICRAQTFEDLHEASCSSDVLWSAR